MKVNNQTPSIKGVVYKYTFQDGKIYIGETINEELRRKNFYRCEYSGSKMNEHIKKFEGEDKYEVLHTGFFKTKCDAKIWLHQVEKEEILKHNSRLTVLNVNYGFLTAAVIKKRVITYTRLT